MLYVWAFVFDLLLLPSATNAFTGQEHLLLVCPVACCIVSKVLHVCVHLMLHQIHSLDAHLAACCMQDGSTDTTIAPTGAFSLAFSRTPAEVLAIVYLGSASMPGGFFPNGLNGSIR